MSTFCVTNISDSGNIFWDMGPLSLFIDWPSYKNHINFIQNLVFITVDYAPVICNHSPFPPPTPHTQMENSGDNGFSSITALGPAERHSPAVYNNKLNDIYIHNITSPAAGELKS